MRLLKVWVGDPSYGTIAGRVNAAWTAAGRPAGDLAGKTTVVDCFRTGRRRVNTDLVVAVVQALHPDVGYVSQWRQALRVVRGQIRAAAQVRVQDKLPQDLDTFTGRTGELGRLLTASLRPEVGGGRGMVCMIAGMAGVGKTQFAVHAAHRLVQGGLAAGTPLDRLLFVNLRGFDPDPAQPPADPSAVLEGFLHLLSVPGSQIPHDLNARMAAYRARLAGTRTVVVLDNAADADQVAPLLPGTSHPHGCLVLVTSRRALPDVNPDLELGLDVFDPDEARDFLTRVAPGVRVGDDAYAAARIARRCGHLPLALGLVAAHALGAPDWTLTDHADRLDERHTDRRLEPGVEAAFDLSYRHLPADRQHLLRLVALHPGQDFDAYAAAALTGIDLRSAQAHLDHLSRDHLLHQHSAERYTFHDLVRTYATTRAGDQDSPSVRRAALTRLFDYYLATAATAMDALYAGDIPARPNIPHPGVPTPDVNVPEAAVVWLDAERHTLTAVAAYAATNGWLDHAPLMSSTLFRYLAGGHHDEALIIHGHALHAARQAGDLSGQAHALTNLANVEIWRDRYVAASGHLHEALALFRKIGDLIGQTRPLSSLGALETRQGRHGLAADHFEEALHLCRRAGCVGGEAYALTNLGIVETHQGRHGLAADHFQAALPLFRQAGGVSGTAWVLNELGRVEMRLGHYDPAQECLEQAIALFRQLGNQVLEAETLDTLGSLCTLRAQPAQARKYHQRALTVFRATGERARQTCALNGLGEATVGYPAQAIRHHTEALAIATDISDLDQQARAHSGLAQIHRILNHLVLARHHYEHALMIYTGLGSSDADQIKTLLATLDRD